MKQTKFVIVKINNAQHKVSEGEEIQVLRLEGEVGTKLNFPEVLLKADGEKVEVGTPTLTGSSVSAEIIEHTLGEKVKSITYKAKARFRKRVGSRQHLTKIKITKIS